MRKFTRAVLGIALLSAGALVAPCRAADSDKYIPGHTEAVVAIHVKQILAAPLVKNNLALVQQALLLQASEAKKTLDEIGFDPLRDVDSVVLALGQDANQALILVNGTFDPAKIQAKALETAKERKLLKINTASSYTIYEVKPPEKGETLHVAVIDSSLVVASQNKELVVEVLDKKAGRKKAELKKELLPLLAKIDPNQSVAIVALAGALANSGQSLADKVQNITGGITVAEDVKAELVLATRNVQDAKAIEGELKDGLDQVKNLVELMANQNKDMKPLVDIVGTLKLVAEGRAVTLKGHISKEIIGKAIANKQ